MKIYRLNGWEYWYDRHTRVWWCSIKDDCGNQIGNAAHAATKQEIIDHIKGQ